MAVGLPRKICYSFHESDDGDGEHRKYELKEGENEYHAGLGPAGFFEGVVDWSVREDFLFAEFDRGDLERDGDELGDHHE